MRATRWAAGCFAAALLLAVLAALAAVPSARAQILTATFTFDDMFPGDTQSGSQPFELPVDATLEDVEITVLENTADAFSWRVDLCPPTGACGIVTETSVGTEFPSGAYTLGLTVTLADDAPVDATSTIEGRLRFVETTDDDGGDGGGDDGDDGGDGDDGLAGTGVSLQAALFVVVLAIAGVVLLAVARRAVRGERDV